jgi:hypothetical protein
MFLGAFRLQTTTEDKKSQTPRMSPASGPGNSSGPGQGGDNLNLKGALTRYSVDLMIPARSLQFELAQDGHHHVRMEAGLMV